MLWNVNHYVERHHTINTMASIKNIMIKLPSGISFIFSSYVLYGRGRVYINRILAYIIVLYEAFFFLYYWVYVYFFFIGKFVAIIYNVFRVQNIRYTPIVVLSECIPLLDEDNSWNRRLVIDKLTYISKHLNYITHYHYCTTQSGFPIQ